MATRILQRYRAEYSGFSVAEASPRVQTSELQPTDEVIDLAKDVALVGPEQIVIRVWDKDYARARDLGFESLCSILCEAQESRRMGNIEDGQHRNAKVRVLLLAIEDRGDYGIVRRVRWRQGVKILYSLLQFPLQLPSLGKHFRKRFRVQMKVPKCNWSSLSRIAIESPAATY